LPILRSQQQGEILALLLGDPRSRTQPDRDRRPDRRPSPVGLPRDLARRTGRPGHLAEDREHAAGPGQHCQPLLQRPSRDPDQGIRRPRRPDRSPARRQRDRRGLYLLL